MCHMENTVVVSKVHKFLPSKTLRSSAGDRQYGIHQIILLQSGLYLYLGPILSLSLLVPPLSLFLPFLIFPFSSLVGMARERRKSHFEFSCSIFQAWHKVLNLLKSQVQYWCSARVMMSVFFINTAIEGWPSYQLACEMTMTCWM